MCVFVKICAFVHIYLILDILYYILYLIKIRQMNLSKLEK